MKNAETSGMCTDVNLFVRFIYVDGFHIIRSKPFLLGVVGEFPGLGVIVIYSASISSYPKAFLCIFPDAIDDIAVQRIGFGGELQIPEAVFQRMIIIDSSEISAQPHSTLCVHEDVTYGHLRKTSVFQRVAGVNVEVVFLLVVNIQGVDGAYPQPVLGVECK